MHPVSRSSASAKTKPLLGSDRKEPIKSDHFFGLSRGEICWGSGHLGKKALSDLIGFFRRASYQAFAL
jgi:hypothetical protein